MIGDLIVFFLIVAVCILCYGIGRVALLHRERQPFWPVLTEIFSIPYWHLFGELDLDENSDGRFPTCDSDPTSCHQSPHSWIVPIMLAVYMLIGNILLVNMLIAVFTHVFDEVNTNSREIYLFEIYVSGLQFSRRSILPPPFLIAEDVLWGTYFVLEILYQKICTKCCCCMQRRDGKCQMQKRLHRVHIGNLRLFEKEARAKYQKKLLSLDEQSFEAAKIDQRICLLRDLVKKVHQLGSNRNHTVKRSKSKEFSSGNKGKTNHLKPEEEEEHSHPETDSYFSQWIIQKSASEQNLIKSCVEVENRLLQIENYLTYIVNKLDKMDINAAIPVPD